MTPTRYRSDIDGLRAIAVISVLLFHVGFGTFSGGYVGVDVFFVISGFLITRLIRDEVIKTDGFSFANFYMRRARRLFPALFFTLIISFVFAAILFSPSELQSFGGSLVHAIMSISNIYFWSESGYFETGSEFQPLLHTWSLSVEEQFYMVWPLLLVFMLLKLPRFLAPVILLIGCAISFQMNLIFADGFTYFKSLVDMFADGPATIFFLTPFRVFELGIGALLVWVVDHQPKNKAVLEPLVITGLLMIAYPIFAYTEKTIFPSYNALLPCIGTALIIYAGTAKYSGRLLSNQATVSVGLISYSLYLIHWPMIVFYRHWKGGNLTMLEQVGICVASMIGAVLMYRFIEQPFRQASKPGAWSRPAFGLSCAMLAMLLILPSANTWATGGWLWRLPVDEQMRLGGMRYLGQYVVSFFNSRNKHQFDPSDSRENVMIIGDSMREDFSNILNVPHFRKRVELATTKISTQCQIVFGASEETYKELYKEEGHRNWCKNLHQKTLNDPRIAKADRIVLASNWEMRSVKHLETTLEALRQKGAKNVFIVGAKKQSNAGVHKLFDLAAHNPGWSARIKLRNQTLAVNEAIKRVIPRDRFLDINAYICDLEWCDTMDQQSRPIFFDNAHLTPYGVHHFADMLIAQDWYFNFPDPAAATSHARRK